MALFLRSFLALYLGHCLTDFVLQSNGLVARKRAGEFSAYLRHGVIHYLSTLGILTLFVPGIFYQWTTHAVLLALSIVHLLVDFAKIQLTKSETISDGTRSFLTDQLLHLATVVVAAEILVPDLQFVSFQAQLTNLRALPDRFLTVPLVYLAVVFGGGYLIRLLTQSLAENLKKSHSQEKLSDQLQNAGLYIGWLERFLVITAMLLQSPATIGLMLTAKSIARYPEFKSERFAEYFLIGTLLSISLAIVGGALLAKIIYGHVKFAG